MFQLNAPSPSGWDQIFNNVINIQQIFKDDGVQVAIVFFGKGLPMLLKTNTAYAERLKQAADKGVILAACQNSMRVQKVKSEDIFPFSTEVDSGVAELVRKQEAGWTYIKGGEQARFQIRCLPCLDSCLQNDGIPWALNGVFFRLPALWRTHIDGARYLGEGANLYRRLRSLLPTH